MSILKRREKRTRPILIASARPVCRATINQARRERGSGRPKCEEENNNQSKRREKDLNVDSSCMSILCSSWERVATSASDYSASVASLWAYISKQIVQQQVLRTAGGSIVYISEAKSMHSAMCASVDREQNYPRQSVVKLAHICLSWQVCGRRRPAAAS